MNLKRNKKILQLTVFSICILIYINVFAEKAKPIYATTTELSTEIKARQTADSTESNARKTADSALQNEIALSLHSIGEAYGGGIVFYVYDGGQHGLIAAADDQNAGVPIRWYGGTFTNTFARANGIGAGKANTLLIIANQAGVDGNPFAASVCNEYSSTDANGIAYGDWYLPSQSELNLLHSQSGIVGNFSQNNYWSSTESSNKHVWAHSFPPKGGQDLFNKDSLLPIRCIRSF